MRSLSKDLLTYSATGFLSSSDHWKKDDPECKGSEQYSVERMRCYWNEQAKTSLSWTHESTVDSIHKAVMGQLQKVTALLSRCGPNKAAVFWTQLKEIGISFKRNFNLVKEHNTACNLLGAVQLVQSSGTSARPHCFPPPASE